MIGCVPFEVIFFNFDFELCLDTRYKYLIELLLSSHDIVILAYVGNLRIGGANIYFSLSLNFVSFSDVFLEPFLIQPSKWLYQALVLVQLILDDRDGSIDVLLCASNIVVLFDLRR